MLFEIVKTVWEAGVLEILAREEITELLYIPQ